MILNSSVPIEHIYFHIPFCLKKCSYCSFYSENYTEQKSTKFINNLITELELFQQKYILKPKTIYFGGGTPSLLKPGQIKDIISSIDVSTNVEITIEANPKTITQQKAEEWLKEGINRISLGAQSFLSKELEMLGRLHSVNDFLISWNLLKNTGFKNLSLDLMYGLPNQTSSDLIFSLKEAVKLNPQHISIYCLSLEKDVPLYTLKDQIVSDEAVAKFYKIIRRELMGDGFQQYEISNFALSGFESKHNIAYWNDSFYAGLGPSASGYLPIGNTGRFRYTNKMNIGDYFHDIKNGLIAASPQTITKDEHQKEYIFLGLRRTCGIDLIQFKDRFQEDFLKKYSTIITKYQKLDLLEITSERIKLKPEAYFISNEIFNEFI